MVHTCASSILFLPAEENSPNLSECVDGNERVRIRRVHIGVATHVAPHAELSPGGS